MTILTEKVHGAYNNETSYNRYRYDHQKNYTLRLCQKMLFVLPNNFFIKEI